MSRYTHQINLSINSLCKFFLLSGLIVHQAAHAIDWQDTSVSWRYGSRFAEPYNSQPISKQIVGITYANGYRYGSNFLGIDLLLSDDKDPSAFGSSAGAREAYVVYRHTIDLGKVRGEDIKWGLMRGLGMTVGFDWNAKEDVGYNSRKRMFVAGPTMMLDVPGFLNISLLGLVESNRPSVSPGAFDPGYPSSRYEFKPHPMLALVWGIPVSERLSFDGYANFIAAKGRDEVGAGTVAETNIDMRLMGDVGSAFGLDRNAFKLGIQYQYWRNKFGNDHNGAAGSGAFARTPMIRAEIHF